MRLIRSFVDNLATFLLALLLAFVIWLVAVRTDDPVDTRALELPVRTVNLPAGNLLITSSNETVQIEIGGPTSLLTMLTADDFSAVADLSQVPLGETAVDIQVQLINDSLDAEQLTIASQFPAQTITDIDQLVTAEVPILLAINGTPSRGYEQGTAVADPSSIQITGPSRDVNEIAEARTTVFIENRAEDFVVTRRPTFYNQSGLVTGIDGLTTDVDTIRVVVPISQLAGFANKPITVDWSGNPADGYNLLEVSVSPENVLVTGTPAQLDALRFLETEPLNITGLQDSFTQQVTLQIPDGIRLDEVEPIFVEFIVEPKLDSSELTTRPEIRGIGEGLTATLGIEDVTVVLFGPVPILNTLLPSDVRVTLDLFDLEPGEYNLAPIVDVFADDVEVRSTNPAQIPVFITNVLTTTTTVTDTLPITNTIPTTDTFNVDPTLPLTASMPAPAGSPLATFMPPAQLALWHEARLVA